MPIGPAIYSPLTEPDNCIMWKTATVICVALGILSIVVTEVLRSIVDRKRLERDGLGGTQDIAIGGMIFGWLCVLGAIVCGAVWMFQL